MAKRLSQPVAGLGSPAILLIIDAEKVYNVVCGIGWARTAFDRKLALDYKVCLSMLCLRVLSTCRYPV